MVFKPFFIMRGAASSESGDAARDGPLGEDVRERCRAEVDLEAAAAVASALALSFWWSMVVIKDRREVRLGLESTRWKKVFSSMLAFPLSSTESSQSDESSSSSIALSSISSSSVSKTSSSNGCSSLIVRVATSSLNDVTFLFSGRLSANALCFIFCGSELSSSLDEPPKLKIAFFFCIVGLRLLSMELVWSLTESSPDDPPNANIWFFFGCGPLEAGASTRSVVGREEGAVRRGIDRYDELICAGEKPLTTLVVLLSEVALAEEACELGAESDVVSEVMEASTGSTI